MNLIIETKKRLKFEIDRLADLQECHQQNISEDAAKYIEHEIQRVKKNIRYYEVLIAVLQIG